MAKRFSRKDMKKDEIAEAAFDVGHWIERNWRGLVAGLGALAVIALAIVAWSFLAGQRRAEAELLLAQTMQAYSLAEKNGFANDDQLADALAAADSAIADARNEKVVRVARYYRAATLRRLGRIGEAVEALEQIRADGTPAIDNGATELLLANLYVQNGRTPDAVALLETSAAGSAGLPPEVALLRLGEILRGTGDEAGARAAWKRIVTEYPDSGSVSEARRFLGPA